MSVVIIRNSNIKYVSEGFIDTRDEIQSLPKDQYHPGTALVALDDGSVWVLNEEYIWKELIVSEKEKT